MASQVFSCPADPRQVLVAWTADQGSTWSAQVVEADGPQLGSLWKPLWDVLFDKGLVTQGGAPEPENTKTWEDAVGRHFREYKKDGVRFVVCRHQWTTGGNQQQGYEAHDTDEGRVLRYESGDQHQLGTDVSVAFP